MRFGLVHRIMTNALAALGVLALVASGQFDRWVSIIVVAGLVLALSVRESWQRHPAMRHLDSAALLIVAALQVGRLVFGASLLDVLIEFAAALQIIRLATRKGAAHDQQVIVLALLHLIAGTVLGGGLAYGACFVGVLVVAPGALVLSHLRREVEGNYRQGARDRTGLPVDVPRILRSRRVVGRTFLTVTCLLSIPIFIFTAALFVIFPRVGLSLLLLSRGQTGRMIGFSGKVDLGEVGVLRADPTIAMRIEIEDLPDPPPKRLTLHLRGTALDAYDGRSWTQSLKTQNEIAPLDAGLIALEDGLFPDTEADGLMKIDLQPIEPPVVFLPPNATGMRFRLRNHLGTEVSGNARSGPDGEFQYYPKDERGIKYDVYTSRQGTPTFRNLLGDRERYLALPDDMPERIEELAAEWTEGITSPFEQAKAIERRLRTEYRYDLQSPSGKSDQPLDHFLFESKRGHCEYYSTAMAVMLRTLDVPTRNVTGFAGGTYNRFGNFYVVRQGDAHSWVEVYLDGRGWITFDPTPPASALPLSQEGALAYLRDLLEATSQRWDRHVVGYDFQQQVGLLSTLSSRYQTGTRRFPGWSKRRIAIGVGLFLVAGAGIVLIVLHRRRQKERPLPGERSARSRSALLATSLYELLDAAMSAAGVGRSPGTPPLRHAEALSEMGHPLGDEIVSLTQLYLDARFGGRVLEEDDRRDFEARVRALQEAERRAATEAFAQAS